MLSPRILMLASIGSLVTAWPEPTPAVNLEDRAVNCAKVTGALSVLKNLGPPATTFCRSYLKVPGTSTVTTTTTPATVTSTTSTVTVEVTRAACPASPKRHVIYDSRGSRVGSLEDVEKRTDVLALLGVFAAAKISEGCRCLNLQATLTKTATLTAAAPTVKVAATLTKCVVVQPVCKASDLDSACTSASQCCSGLCVSVLESPSCCDAVGKPCYVGDPGTCCSGTCGFVREGVGSTCF